MRRKWSLSELLAYISNSSGGLELRPALCQQHGERAKPSILEVDGAGVAQPFNGVQHYYWRNCLEIVLANKHSAWLRTEKCRIVDKKVLVEKYELGSGGNYIQTVFGTHAPLVGERESQTVYKRLTVMLHTVHRRRQTTETTKCRWRTEIMADLLSQIPSTLWARSHQSRAEM